MKTQNSGSQRWEDIVFEHRNKLYGAYAIRKSYHNHVMKAMIVAVGIFGVAFILPKPPKIDIQNTMPLDSTFVVLDPDIIIPPPKKFEEPAKPSAHRDIIPTRVTTMDVPEDTTRIITDTQPISIAVGTGDPSATSEPTGSDADVGDEPTGNGQPFVLMPEVMPSYDGGLSAMMKFLQSKLRYPSRASRMGIEGSVFVSFIIDVDGAVTQVEVIKGIYPDCDKEAARVVALMNSWKAGMQNRRPVPVKMVLPIKFSLGK